MFWYFFTFLVAPNSFETQGDEKCIPVYNVEVWTKIYPTILLQNMGKADYPMFMSIRFLEQKRARSSTMMLVLLATRLDLVESAWARIINDIFDPLYLFSFLFVFQNKAMDVVDSLSQGCSALKKMGGAHIHQSFLDTRRSQGHI